MTDRPATFYPRVGFKYCGGCNPLYERGAIIARLRKEYPGIVTAPVGDDENAFDIVVIVLGCSRNECLDYRRLRGRLGQVIITEPGGYASLTHFLSQWRMRYELKE